MKYTSFFFRATTALLYFLFAFTSLSCKPLPRLRVPKSFVFDNHTISSLWIKVEDHEGKPLSPAKDMYRFLPAGGSTRTFYAPVAKFPLKATLYHNSNNKVGKQIKVQPIAHPTNPQKNEEVIHILGKADNETTLRIEQEKDTLSPVPSLEITVAKP